MVVFSGFPWPSMVVERLTSVARNSLAMNQCVLSLFPSATHHDS